MMFLKLTWNRAIFIHIDWGYSMKRTKLDDRVLPEYTRGEEIFNMVTHIVGGVLELPY